LVLLERQPAQFVPDDLPEQGKYRVQVPAPWQTQADDLRDYTGIGWYQRDLHVDTGWLEQRRLLLMFGAVDYLAQVWVNGQLAGEHEGGYLPFELDITELVNAGGNTLVVRVAYTSGRFRRGSPRQAVSGMVPSLASGRMFG
jgi:beta-galactosidase/beta-glucuronidase